MKKVFFLTAFFLSISMFGYSQINVINNTSEDLLVTVQYPGTEDCTGGVTEMETLIESGDDETIGTGPIYRVGVSGDLGIDWSSPCLECGEGTGGYVFMWGPACGTVIVM